MRIYTDYKDNNQRKSAFIRVSIKEKLSVTPCYSVVKNSPCSFLIVILCFLKELM